MPSKVLCVVAQLKAELGPFATSESWRESSYSKQSKLEFIGVRVPTVRKIARTKLTAQLSVDELVPLLESRCFEVVSLALYILQDPKFDIASAAVKRLLRSSDEWLEYWALADDLSLAVNKWLHRGVILPSCIWGLHTGTTLQRRVAITCWVRYNSPTSVFRCSTAERIYEALKGAQPRILAQGIRWYEREYLQ